MVYAELEEGMTLEEIQESDKKARERALNFVRQYAPMFQKSLGATDAE
jgi:hypothetical protein